MEQDALGTPRWVKVAGIVAVVLVVVFLIVMLTGGHGPGRHTLTDSPAPFARA